jgi:hypothetical protein
MDSDVLRLHLLLLMLTEAAYRDILFLTHLHQTATVKTIASAFSAGALQRSNNFLFTTGGARLFLALPIHLNAGMAHGRVDRKPGVDIFM